MSAYSAGVGAIMFDAQLKRAEALEAKAAADGRELVTKAAGAVQGVKGALLANAVVTGVSTVILVTQALRSRRRR
jgi:hypothetical protein